MRKVPLKNIQVHASDLTSYQSPRHDRAINAARQLVETLEALEVGYCLTAKQLSEKLDAGGFKVSMRQVRKIIKALRAGGVVIHSSSSKGYWIKGGADWHWSDCNVVRHFQRGFSPEEIAGMDGRSLSVIEGILSKAGCDLQRPRKIWS